MKDYGSGVLTQRLDKKRGELQGPVVLQLVRWRNVSHPKIPEHLDSDGLCKLTLTDGVVAVDALQVEPVAGLSGRTSFGSKLLLTGRVPYESGMLLLESAQCRVLGGFIEKLVEKWQALRVGILMGVLDEHPMLPASDFPLRPRHFIHYHNVNLRLFHRTEQMQA